MRRSKFINRASVTPKRIRLQDNEPDCTTELNQATGQRTLSSSTDSYADVLERSVMRSGLTHESFVRSLTASAFGRLIVWSQADLERLLVTAERLSLDPLGGEIYAMPRTSFGFTDTSANGQCDSPVILALSIDGWSKVINAHPQFDGMSFSESQAQQSGLPLYLECTLYRKDRRVATSVREYMSEVNTASGAWLTHPRRMLRHKAMVQCARLSFGLGCLYEPDEAERVRDAISGGASGQNLKSISGLGSEKVNAAARPNPPKGTEAVKGWLQSRVA
jgi:hypothetical protein